MTDYHRNYQTNSNHKWLRYVITTLIFSLSVFFVKIIDNLSVVKGVETPPSSYVIAMGGSNGWASYSGTGYQNKSQTHRYVIMDFKDYILTSNKDAQLKESTGAIYNNSSTPITGLQSIQLTYSSAATMRVYYGPNAAPSSTYKLVTSGSIVDFSDVNAPYIRINSFSKYATITSATITYTCSDTVPPPTIPVTSISLSGTASIQVAGTTQLTATISPETATDKSVSWTSLNPTIADVSPQGLVTGIAVGSATIRATNLASGVYGQLVVNVSAIPSSGGNATWERVTANNQLVAGDQYAFVYMTTSLGRIASNSLVGSNVYLISNNFASNTTSVDASDYSSSSYGWVLGGSTGAWTFHNGAGYLYATAASKLAIASNPTTKTWSLTLDSNNYAVATFATSSYGRIQYNTQDPRFNIYTSSQASIYLYRLVDGGPKPISISVTDNSNYKVNDTFNRHDFSVSITFSDNTTLANVNYDASMTNGYYFGQAYDPNDELFNHTTPFITGGDYAIEIYYVDASGTCNDIHIFTVLSGSQLGDTLVDLSVTDNGSYTIGATFISSHQLSVIATWATYGSEYITLGNGIDGYSLSCATHDLTTPFTSGGNYMIEVSYRSLTATVSIVVAEGYQKQPLLYNYENMQDRSVYYIDAMPSIGNPKVLVIPTKFTDTSLNSAQLSSYKTKIEKAYFGTDADTGWKSVKTYFEESSYGQLSIDGKVTDWWDSGYASSAVTNETITTTLVKNAVSWYKANNTDIKDYDTNGDGYIDAISLIYGAPNYYNGGANDNLWAYCYWVQETSQKNVNNPGPNVFFWASYDFMEEDTTPAPIDTHTYIHEMGHVLGLDDYYNYDSSSTDGAAGGFIMQDYNVGDHDPYSKMALGWVSPYVPTASTSITLRPFESSGDVIVLAPSFNNSPFDEYLVIDYYTATGLNYFDSRNQYGTNYPRGTTNKGIRVWHVDARLFQTSTRTTSYTTSTTLTSTISSSYYYTHAMSNSTGSTYGSRVSSYRNYRLLHLLQAGGTNTFKNGATFSSGDLWTQGMSFSMASYSGFFYNPGKLNTNQNLGWSFSVTSLSEQEAVLQITKL